LSTSKQPDRELVALGEAIRQMREQYGMSRSELAAATGIERERLDVIEAGQLDPTYDVLLALAEGLGVQIEALVIRAKELSEPGGS
jgi:transcriptional regulator with XRE-family HTH domain